jgi:N-acetylglucosamine kinase-like BadF-type ATPase
VSIFLGIDAGGSKTTCVAGNEHSVLASATTGGSNDIRWGEAEARTQLHEAMQRACAEANVRLEDVRRICVGIAGAGRPVINSIVKGIVAEIFAGEVEVVGDMVVAMQAAFGNKQGVIVIGGTGSIAYGRNSEGKIARAGGWGFAISDEGSGHWIGRAAVAAVMRAQDEDEASPTGLALSILHAWHLKTLDDLVRAANASPPADFSNLFPHVLAAAETGDPIARGVLTQAGAELAGLAKIVIGRIFEQASNVPVAMTGGVFRNSALVRNVFYNSLRSEYPQAVLSATVVEPVQGALELARQGAQVA